MKGTLTVAVMNMTGGSNKTGPQHFAAWYDDLDIDVTLASEVFRFRRVLRLCGHLRVGRGSHGREDVGVITRRRPIRWKQRQVTRFVDRPGSSKPLLWHDRWVTRVVAGWWPWNRVVAVSSHAPAVIQNGQTGRLLDNPGAREWAANGQPKTEAMLRRDMRRNRRLVHGGDLNQHPGDGPENPAQMYARLGMEYRTNGVMWFAWNPRRFELVSGEWLTTPPGSDGHRTGLFTLRRL